VEVCGRSARAHVHAESARDWPYELVLRYSVTFTYAFMNVYVNANRYAPPVRTRAPSKQTFISVYLRVCTSRTFIVHEPFL
jgi:hypothetical protein